MNPFKQVMEFIRGEGGNASAGTGAAANPVPPLSPEGRKIAARALHQTVTPHHADESHILFRTIGEDGDVTEHSEEWRREGTGMKSVEKSCLVTTVTGDVVSPKEIRIQCQFCRGYDTVGVHCRCGIAICRRHTLPSPVDGTPLCPNCHSHALESFDTWAAHDRQQSTKQSES